ncbi:MAG: T9SS type A sorting domain-containing protein [Candidatus Kapabacteria bacterium]|nr:T9SS type A sorting domain-containing protein [Candidatus Kapabacteria bacterium]
MKYIYILTIFILSTLKLLSWNIEWWNKGFLDEIKRIKISSNEQFIAAETVTDSGLIIRQWDIQQRTKVFETKSLGIYFEISSDGALLAVSDSNSFSIYDTKKTELIKKENIPNQRKISNLAFVPNSSKLIIEYKTDSAIAIYVLYDCIAKKIDNQFFITNKNAYRAHKSLPLIFTSDGKNLISRNMDDYSDLYITTENDMFILNLETGNITYRNQIHKFIFDKLLISPDDKYIAALYYNNTQAKYYVDFLNISNFSVQKSILLGSIPETAVGFDKTDNSLRFWYSNGLIKKIAANGTNFDSSKVKISSNGAAFLSNNRFISYMSHILSIWDISSAYQNLYEINGYSGSSPVGYLQSVDISPDNKIVATSGQDKVIRLWDSKTGNILTTLTGNKNICNSIMFSPDGQYLAANQTLDSAKILIWKLSDFSLFRTLYNSDDSSSVFSWSPDSKSIASGGYSVITTTIFDISSGKITNSFPLNSKLTALAYSKSGNWIGSGTGAGYYHVYDYLKLTDISAWQIRPTNPAIYSMEFSTNDSVFTVACQDATIRIISSVNRRLSKSFTCLSEQGKLITPIRSQLSKDGKTLWGTSSQFIMGWDTSRVQVNQLVTEMYDRDTLISIRYSAVSPDETFIMVGTQRGDLIRLKVNPVSVTEPVPDKNELIISPNPANDLINVDIAESFSLVIYNQLGEKVHSSENEHQVDISTLSSGMYYCTIRVGAMVLVRAVVVSR